MAVYDFPPVVRIEPASACNLKCSHCPTGVVKMVREVMPEEVFERVLQGLERNREKIRVVVMYHGGEPLLNKRFPEMVRRVKAIGIPFVKTVSNGMMLTEKVGAELLESGLDAIEFSMDGQSPEENDRVRRNAEYFQVRDNVLRFLDMRKAAGSSIEVAVSTTQFVTMGKDVGEPPIPEYISRDFERYSDTIQWKAVWAVQWPAGQPERGYDRLWDDSSPNTATSCDLLTDTISVRASGTVVACCYDLTTLSDLGSVLDAHLDEIWYNESFQEFRRRFAERDYPEVCKNCARVTGSKYLVPREDDEVGREFRMSETVANRV